MFNVLFERLQQGHRTSAYPAAPAPNRPERFRGLPMLNEARCRGGCQECVEACPTNAITHAGNELALDMGRCLFCTDCQEACPDEVIEFSNDYRLASSTRDGLRINGKPHEMAKAMGENIRRIFGRSFKLRQVSAGGCNGCEADVNVLNTIVFDLSRFGIQFVASPRHADGLLITGPVTENMRVALLKTYEAVPSPKVVIAVGACAISGGPYIGHPEAHDGADSVVPVDLYVPGCPPSPWTILDGILRFIGALQPKHPDFARQG